MSVFKEFFYYFTSTKTVLFYLYQTIVLSVKTTSVLIKLKKDVRIFTDVFLLILYNGSEFLENYTIYSIYIETS